MSRSNDLVEYNHQQISVRTCELFQLLHTPNLLSICSVTSENWNVHGDGRSVRLIQPNSEISLATQKE